MKLKIDLEILGNDGNRSTQADRTLNLSDGDVQAITLDRGSDVEKRVMKAIMTEAYGVIKASFGIDHAQVGLDTSVVNEQLHVIHQEDKAKNLKVVDNHKPGVVEPTTVEKPVEKVEKKAEAPVEKKEVVKTDNEKPKAEVEPETGKAKTNDINLSEFARFRMDADDKPVSDDAAKALKSKLEAVNDSDAVVEQPKEEKSEAVAKKVEPVVNKASEADDVPISSGVDNSAAVKADIKESDVLSSSQAEAEKESTVKSDSDSSKETADTKELKIPGLDALEKSLKKMRTGESGGGDQPVAGISDDKGDDDDSLYAD